MEGGNSLSKENESFTFDLKETLYFEKGQEVLEMIGISLDPEISIQSLGDYISLRGVISLQGEYEKVKEQDTSEMEELDDQINHSHRYLERIIDTEDGKAEFLQRFPVEVSIPSYRVINMDDVIVGIDSFDYEFPKNNQMEIHARIEILGIIDDTIDEEQEENQLIKEELNQESNTFEFELKDVLTASPTEENNASQEVVENKEEKQELEAREPTENKDKPLKLVEERQVDEVKEEKNKEVNETKEDRSNEDIASTVEELDESQVLEVDMIADESEEEEEVKDIHFLAELFRKENEEEQEEYTQLRICIVQERDTLEKIAERYDVPKLKILKQNQLEDDHVDEGQLLTIPVIKK